METTRNFIAVLVKLTTSVQLGHNDFSGTSFGLVFIVVLNARRYTAAIINNRNRIISLNDNSDLRAVSGQGLINRVIKNFKYKVV